MYSLSQKTHKYKKKKTNENDNKHKTQLKPNKQKQGHNAFGPYQVNSNKKTVIVTARS